MVQWLGLHAFTVEGPGSIPDWGTEILQTLWHSQKKKDHILLRILGKIQRLCSPSISHGPSQVCPVYCIFSHYCIIIIISCTNAHSLGAAACPSLLPPKLRTQSLASTLDPEQPGRQNLGGSRPHPVGVVGRGQGGSWLAGRTGSGLSWTLRSLLRLNWQGPGKG